MNKGDLKTELNHRLIMSQRFIDPVVDALFDVIRDELKNGGKVMIENFGTFDTKTHKGTRKFDPETNKRIDTGETRIAKFKPSPKLNKAIDESWDGKHGES